MDDSIVILSAEPANELRKVFPELLEIPGDSLQQRLYVVFVKNEYGPEESLQQVMTALNDAWLRASCFIGVASSYDDGKCPDCGSVIEPFFVEGDACSKCGRVFYVEAPTHFTQIREKR